MPGQRRLHGDQRRFGVANFTDHHDVRVLAQERPQTGGERQSDFRMDLHLVDTLNVVLDGVFDRHDLRLGVVDRVQRCVQRRRFTRTGRARYQEHTVGKLNQLLPDIEQIDVKSKLIEFDHDALAVENTHDDRLAIQAGQHRHTQIVAVALYVDLNAAVLRKALLRDVEVRHDFEAGKQRRLNCLGRVHHDPEHTVYPVSHDHLAFERLDVNIGSLERNGLGDDKVRQPDDRRVDDDFVRKFLLLLDDV